MMDFWAKIEHWLEFLKVYAEGIVAATLIFGFLYAVAKKGQALIVFFKDVSKIPGRVKEIMAEVKPKGGSSLKDAVCRIEDKQFITDQKFLFALEKGSSVSGMFGTDKDGLCNFVSSGYCEIVGRAEADSLGNNWIENIHEDDRDNVFKKWEDCIKSKKMFDMEYSMINKHGHIEIPIVCRATPIRNTKGEITSWFGIITVKN